MAINTYRDQLMSDFGDRMIRAAGGDDSEVDEVLRQREAQDLMALYDRPHPRKVPPGTKLI